MTEATCPNCKKQYKVDSIYIGRHAECPQCKHVFVIPAASHQKPGFSGNPYAKPSDLRSPQTQQYPTQAYPSSPSSSSFYAAPKAKNREKGGARVRRLVCALLLLGCVAGLGLLNSGLVADTYLHLTGNSGIETAKIFPADTTTIYYNMPSIKKAGYGANIIYEKLKEVLDDDIISDKDVFREISKMTEEKIGKTVESVEDMDELGLLNAGISVGIIKDGDTSITVGITTSDKADLLAEMSYKKTKEDFEQLLIVKDLDTALVETTISHQDTEIRILRMENDNAKSMLYYVSCVVENHHIEYQDSFDDEEDAVRLMKDMLDCWNDEGDSLAELDDFQKAVERLSSDRLASVFVNLPLIIKPDKDNEDSEMAKHLKKSIGCFSAEFLINGDGISLSAHLRLPEDSMWRDSFTPDRFEPERFMPEDGFLGFEEMNLDIGGVIKIIKTCIESNSAEGKANFEKFREECKKNLKIDICTDLEEMFTGKFSHATYDYPVSPDISISSIAIFEVKGPEELWAYSDIIIKHGKTKGTIIKKIKIEGYNALAILLNHNPGFSSPIGPREARRPDGRATVSYAQYEREGEDDEEDISEYAGMIVYAVIVDDALLLSCSRSLLNNAIKVYQDKEGAVAQCSDIANRIPDECVYFSHMKISEIYDIGEPFFKKIAQNDPYRYEAGERDLGEIFSIVGKVVSLFESSTAEGQIDEYGFSYDIWIDFKDKPSLLSYKAAGTCALLAGVAVFLAGIVWPGRKKKIPRPSSIPGTLPFGTPDKMDTDAAFRPSPPPPPTGTNGAV